MKYKTFDEYEKHARKVLGKGDSILASYIFRTFSLRISYFIYKNFPNTDPNDITTLSILIVLISGIFFLSPSPIYWIIGSLGYFIFHIFDCVDGEVARSLNKSSNFGAIYDGLVHQYANPIRILFPGIGIYLYFNNLLFLALTLYVTVAVIVTDDIIVFSRRILKSSSIIREVNEKHYFSGSIKITKIFFGFEGYTISLILSSILDLIIFIFVGYLFVFRVILILIVFLSYLIVHFKFLYRFYRFVKKNR